MHVLWCCEMKIHAPNLCNVPYNNNDNNNLIIIVYINFNRQLEYCDFYIFICSHGNMQFDKFTKTKTVDNLLSMVSKTLLF